MSKPIYQPFAGVRAGLLLSDENCEMLAKAILSGDALQLKQAVAYLSGSARSWYTAIPRDEYERCIKTEESLMRNLKEVGTNE